MSERKTAAELRAELEAAQARLVELRNTKSRLEQQMKMVEDEIEELTPLWRRDTGKIGRLADALVVATLREEHAKLPAVRVIPSYGGECDEFVCVSVGKKRCKLAERGNQHGSQYDLETGKAIGYGGTIHPEDLERIKREGR